MFIFREGGESIVVPCITLFFCITLSRKWLPRRGVGLLAVLFLTSFISRTISWPGERSAPYSTKMTIPREGMPLGAFLHADVATLPCVAGVPVEEEEQEQAAPEGAGGSPTSNGSAGSGDPALDARRARWHVIWRSHFCDSSLGFPRSLNNTLACDR